MNAPINLAKLEENAAALVDAALRAGAQSCDVVVARGQSLGIGVREGKVENTSRSESDDFSLRVFCGSQVASVNANNIKDIDSLAQRAVAMARVSPEDPYPGPRSRRPAGDVGPGPRPLRQPRPRCRGTHRAGARMRKRRSCRRGRRKIHGRKRRMGPFRVRSGDIHRLFRPLFRLALFCVRRHGCGRGHAKWSATTTIIPPPTAPI